MYCTRISTYLADNQTKDNIWTIFFGNFQLLMLIALIYVHVHIVTTKPRRWTMANKTQLMMGIETKLLRSV